MHQHNLIMVENERNAAKSAYLSLLLATHHPILESDSIVLKQTYDRYILCDKQFRAALEAYAQEYRTSETSDRLDAIYYRILPNGQKDGPFIFQVSSNLYPLEVVLHIKARMISPDVDGVLLHRLNGVVVNLLECSRTDRASRAPALLESIPYQEQ